MKRILTLLTIASLLAACGDDDSKNGAINASTNNSYYDNNSTTGYYGDNTSGSANATTGGVSGNNAATNNFGSEPNDPPIQDDTGGEAFTEWVENDWIDASVEATSTFSIDVDNASYTWVRGELERGNLPEPQSVRVEEFVNFFDYAYVEPAEGETIAVDLEVSPSQFGPADSQLLRIGVKAKDVSLEDMKPSNVVLLVDTSGSMSSTDKLAWVKASIAGLADNMRPTDTIGIVTYAGSDTIALEPTPVANRAAIDAAVNNMKSGGGTNGEAGIRTAYDLAIANFIPDGNNRVILMTDGDFNVGITGDALIDYINQQRASKVAITTVGYGTGNYKDYRMEAIAQNGNGNYFYVDGLEEARRIFGTELPSTIEIVASDVKLQMEFDPTTVKEYRLIGYENRLLNNEDFDNDTVDAGDIGPGKRVTAFYEIVLHPGVTSGQLAMGRARFKQPFAETSELSEQVIKLSNRVDFAQASEDLRFGAAVVEFAEILRESKHVDMADLSAVRSIALDASGDSAKRAEFITLIDLAANLLP